MSPISFIRTLFKLGKSVAVGLPDDAEERDPIQLFGEWYVEAEKTGMLLPEAMTLATATPSGTPSARMVLLKGYGAEGLDFYTNYDSRKGLELESNASVALVFHWSALQRQVRILGTASKLPQQVSERYFHTRPRGSQISAWASQQSQILASRQELKQKVKECRELFSGVPVPLPENWGGYRIVPIQIEFWQGRLHRLHDRVCFNRRDEGWEAVRLYP